MSEQNKEAARRILESYNKGPEAAKATRDQVFAADIVVHFPGIPTPLQGREAFEPLIDMFAAAFGEDHVIVEDQVAEGDKVTTRWTWSFTHHGDFQGMPATGKRITISGINYERFAAGKLVERWVEMDQLGMMQQLGVAPSS